jgi:hypothetical protein
MSGSAIRIRSLFVLVPLALCLPGAERMALAGGDCTRTSVGFIPLVDLGTGTYQGFEGGLYPGGAVERPPSHDVAADSFARVALLDASGVPDPLSGRIVLLTVGMSNTNLESQAFIPLADGDPARNQSVVIVNGAQGGWDASRVADPSQNATYWSTVDSRLAAAGVTPLQVEAVWLKEAEARPTQAFPQDAQILESDLETIVQIIKSRYPNTRQVYASSRIYAGYATTDLNPEPYAYESGFSVKGMVQDQLDGAPALNFVPDAGPVLAPWLSWGPYPWADGLVPRGDGLVWECADFQSDGTHPSPSGAAKVAQMLVGFFQNDPIASRWYRDCDPADPAVFSVPPRVLDVRVGPDPSGGFDIGWQSLGPVAGSGTVYDVVAGSIGDLRQTGGFGAARCAAASITAGPISDPAPAPPPGEAVYYLLRGRNGCGIGTYGEPGALPGPRAALDASSPCSNF